MVDRTWVAQVRAILMEVARPLGHLQERTAVPKHRPHASRFPVHSNNRRLQVLEARRIASWYGWQLEIELACARANCSGLEMLPEDDLESLLLRLRQLEDCAQNGLDGPDSPSAI
jgi:hypothetical protein